MARLCRLCISESGSFTDVSELRENLPLSTLIMIICPVKIEPEDPLPKEVCSECLDTVLKAYKLREVSHKMDSYLRLCHEEAPAIEVIKVAQVEIGQQTEAEEEFVMQEITEEDEDDDKQDSQVPEEDGIDRDDDEDEGENELAETEYIIYEAAGLEAEGEDTDDIVKESTEFSYQVLCTNKSIKKSAVWNYIGYLADELGEIVDSEKDFFYCKICVENNQCLKPKYKIESTATSVLFTHLNKVHGLTKEEMLDNMNVVPAPSVAELVECTLCEKTLNSGSLSIHMGIEHRNGAADRPFQRKSSFRVDCFKNSSKSLAWDYFGVLTNLDGTQADEFYFYCRLCVEEEDKRTPRYTKNTSTSILLQHLKNAHVEKSPEELAKRKMPEPITANFNSKRMRREEYSCEVCGHDCETKKALNLHLTKEHGIQQKREFICEFEDCGKAFTMRDSLNKHIKNIHEGSKYPCDQCPALLSSRMSLRRHIESCHLKLKVFSCEKCDSNFAEQKSLKNHFQRVHLGIIEKKVPCEQCDLTFPNQWSLRRHMLTHTLEVR